MTDGRSEGAPSRRDFIKTSALVAGGTGASALGALGSCSHERGFERTGSGLPLTLAGYACDRVDALMDGRVGVEGCDVRFQEAAIGDLNTHVFSGPQTIDVTEIGLHPFMLAYANEGFRDYVLLPIFILRVFRHRSIFIRNDRGIEAPEDLRGKTIATPGYASTSLTWIRGILQDEYGIAPSDVRWVKAAGDSAAQLAGRVSRQESVLPEGLTIAPGPPGKDESDLLESGEVDALFHAAEPRAFVQGHPKVARLFADYRSAERAYFTKTGIFPIMHAVAMKRDLLERHPQLATAVFAAYSKAKAVTYDYLAKSAWARSLVPWLAQEFAETRALMGENYWSYGVEPNRKALEALFRYSYQQGLCRRELGIEEIFDRRVIGLAEEPRRG